MKLQVSTFDIDEFITKLSNSLSNENGLIDWYAIEPHVAKSSSRLPVSDFMLGPISIEQKKIERKRAIRHERNTAQVVEPTQLKETDVKKYENQTTINVKNVYKRLLQVEPIHFFNLIINPQSFSQSVENLFYLSFLIREKRAKISIDKDGLPLVESVKDDDDNEPDNAEPLLNKQLVIDLDMDIWRVIIQLNSC
jgi:hypothetical protein